MNSAWSLLITNPFKELDIAQAHDCFTLTELLTDEDLGLSEKGAAKDHITNGPFDLSGELPVNTDGGLKTFGHPTGATGVRMLYENYKPLQGEAGNGGWACARLCCDASWRSADYAGTCSGPALQQPCWRRLHQP